MKRKHKGLSEQGFTLVELLVAITVGALFVGSINTIYTNQLSISQQSRDAVLANAFVEAKVESLRSQGFLSVNNGTTDITAELPSELQRPRSATLIVTNQSASVKKLAINLSYTNNAKSQTLNYTTYLGELGVGQY